MQVHPGFTPFQGIFQSFPTMNSTFYGYPTSFPQQIPTYHQSASKRKRNEDVEMQDEFRPSKATKLDVHDFTPESPSTVTIEEIKDGDSYSLPDVAVVEEPDDVEYVFTEDQRKKETEKSEEEQPNGALSLYRTPSPSIDLNTLREQLNLRPDLPLDETIAYIRGISGKLELPSTAKEEDSDDEGPKIYEITDEQEEEILKEKEQKKIKSIEEGIQEMDLD